MRLEAALYRLSRMVSLTVLFCSVTACHAFSPDPYRVVHVYPHDPLAFTQGLVYDNGILYESTGLNGRSSLRAVNMRSGAVLQRFDLAEKYFAEGLTDWRGTLIQITWRSHIGFVYDRFSFRFLRSFHFDGEGWGLTQDGRNLILSDGTSTIRFLDPKTYREVRRIHVVEDGSPVGNLNELEYVHGEIYANVWHTSHIVRISPRTGHVLGFLDLSNLLPAEVYGNPEAVLNGIAYNPENGHLLVTGKLWPKLFEIALGPTGRGHSSPNKLEKVALWQSVKPTPH